MSKRIRIAVVPALGLVLGLSSLAAMPATHADDWCWNDPVVSVNGHQAAINVGIQGSSADMLVNVNGADIQIFVPQGSRNQILKTQNGAFTETVHFVQTGDRSKVGEIDVRFDLNPGKAPRDASVQVTQNGKTTTTYGKTRQGVNAHMDVD
jgi:hypothetical protein